MNAPRDCELKLRMSEEDYQFLLSASAKLGIKPATLAYMFVKGELDHMANMLLAVNSVQKARIGPQ